MRAPGALSFRSFLLPLPLSAAVALLSPALLSPVLGGCSSTAPVGGSGGAIGSGGAAGVGGATGSGGGVGSGGAATGGAASGGAGTGGLTSSGGAAPGSGGESAAGGSSSGGASGGADGAGGASSGGSGGTGDCTPNPSGTFVLESNDEVVFDETTCLWWMQENTSGDPYAEATTYCDGLTLGGYDDWRIPTAGEVVSIFKCDSTFPPVEDIFTVVGDGIWTTTETGTVAGDLPKVCGAGQSSGQFYDFGQVGGQNTRCVRGAITLPDRTDCKTVTAICP